MIFVDSKHSVGTVGFITSGGVRFDEFYDALEGLQVPHGTILLKGKNYNAARNRNCICEMATGDWILFLDDDHSWEPDMLMRLLDREVDAVTALYCRRYPPYAPVIYETFEPPAMKLYQWRDLANRTGLLEIGACGAGGLLIRRRALEALGQFPFRVGNANGPEWDETEPDGMHEDTGFCLRLRQAGFKLYVDLDVSAGHLTGVTLIPHVQEDGTYSVISTIAGSPTWLLKVKDERHYCGCDRIQRYGIEAISRIGKTVCQCRGHFNSA